MSNSNANGMNVGAATPLPNPTFANTDLQPQMSQKVFCPHNQFVTHRFLAVRNVPVVLNVSGKAALFSTCPYEIGNINLIYAGCLARVFFDDSPNYIWVDTRRTFPTVDEVNLGNEVFEPRNLSYSGLTQSLINAFPFNKITIIPETSQSGGSDPMEVVTFTNPIDFRVFK